MRSKLKPLGLSDNLHLQAAYGWLELGNHLAADGELDNITASLRTHPDVLEVRWQIHAKANRWDACLDIARSIRELAPDRSSGWIHLSEALHELGRTKEAWENLIVIETKFPREPAIPYDLACYSCRLGRLPEAALHLEKAFEIGNAEELKLRALEDPDLEAFWADGEEAAEK